MKRCRRSGAYQPACTVRQIGFVTAYRPSQNSAKVLLKNWCNFVKQLDCQVKFMCRSNDRLWLAPQFWHLGTPKTHKAFKQFRFAVLSSDRHQRLPMQQIAMLIMRQNPTGTMLLPIHKFAIQIFARPINHTVNKKYPSPINRRFQSWLVWRCMFMHRLVSASSRQSCQTLMK